MKQLPKKIFVKWYDAGDGEPYLQADTDCEGLADDVGGVVSVGTYELTSTGKLATKAEFQADKKRAKRS